MSEKVLAIPELVATVLCHLDLPSLVVAAQVNRMWAHEATNFIWRGEYRQKPYEGMAMVLRNMEDSPPERRNWYTKKIRHLHLGFESEFKEDETTPIALLLEQKEFQFPYIRSLVVEALAEDGHENVVAEFLQPSLICLEVFNGYFSRWFLEQIHANAPLLRVLVLEDCIPDDDAPEDRLNATDFLRFLQAMPSIEVLELTVGWTLSLDVEVMRHIFTRPRLQTLYLGCIILDMQFMNKINLAGEILQDLRSLQMFADEKTLSLILPRLSHLQAVDLSIFGRTPQATALNKLLESLSSCAELREITVLCGSESGAVFDNDSLSSSALLSLATNCRFIRILKVVSELSANMTDELFETMASRLVHLEVLSLKTALIRGISYKTIASFAQHCPSLHELCLSIKVELTLLEGEPDDVKFAELQMLDVARVTFLPVEMAEDCSSVQGTLTQLLGRRFPHLTSLRKIPGSSSHARQMRTSIGNYLRKRPSKPNPRQEVAWKAIKQSILED